MTALHEAARFGRPGVAKLLLRSGAEVDARDGEGRTPLHLAAATKHVVAGRDYPGVVSLLLESGADADAEDGAGKTPLMLAEEAGHTRVVELLRRDGPDM